MTSLRSMPPFPPSFLPPLTPYPYLLFLLLFLSSCTCSYSPVPFLSCVPCSCSCPNPCSCSFHLSRCVLLTLNHQKSPQLSSSFILSHCNLNSISSEYDQPLQLYLIDFSESNGIIELLWQKTQFKHQTTKSHHPSNIEKKIPGLILIWILILFDGFLQFFYYFSS
ncbi:putative signal peptide protein [Puccinia sorghi]|uniref:Putative signal peptide protein n=1 Tax=Puccinia sorghi TaxID=27349 RepID=A0A0L6ULM6_9BASI|nr:putative signal peptide protein [Puccinia sorghi]